MLIVKIFSNQRQLDEIQIQGIGVIDKGTFSYKIIHPPGIEEIFIHKKSVGYESLLTQAMVAICRKQTPIDDTIPLDNKSIASGEK